MSIFKRREKPVVKKFYSVANKNAPFTYVEAYKMLSTNLEFITAAEKCKNIMITSSLANEGKTNTSLNLALTLAGYGKKVCFVECDLRRPTVHRFFDARKGTRGLTNVLTGQVKLDEVIRSVEEGRELDVLFAGSTPPNPSELLASPGMQEVVEGLEKRYDYIIYDTPPVFVVTDAAALGKYMDGAVLVVKHNATDKNVALRAKKNLENAGVKIFGAIYSEFSEKKSSYYAYNYGYYYYDKQTDENKVEGGGEK